MPIDYSTYCHDWKLRSRFIREYRSRGRCEWCGAVNGQPHPITGSIVVLTTAHIDHDKTNNSFFNLAALCQRCHLNHDRDHHIIKRKSPRGQTTIFHVLSDKSDPSHPSHAFEVLFP